MAIKASKIDWSKVDKLVDRTIAVGLVNLGDDIKKRAIILAPKDSGDLRQSGRVQIDTSGDRVATVFGNSIVKYAKRRHYENNLHPSTKLYLTNAMKSIKSVGKYFKRFN